MQAPVPMQDASRSFALDQRTDAYNMTGGLNEMLSGGQQLQRQPSNTGQSMVYSAIYANTPVCRSSPVLKQHTHKPVEMMVRGIGVMRRKHDSFFNATQMLKVAGIDNKQRKQILETEILPTGLFDKVQDGYGRYQGIWIPFSQAKALADQYGITHLLRSILDCAPAPTGDYEMADASVTSTNQKQSFSARSPQTSTDFSAAGINGSSNKREVQEDGENNLPKRPRKHSNRLRLRPSSKHPAQQASIGDDPARLERHRQTLMALFMNPTNSPITIPSDIEPDTVIDDQHSTALHWAATLGRPDLARSLVGRGSDIHRGNRAGETPLIRAVLAANSHEEDSFPALLDLLAPSLRTLDDFRRTILHHIATTAGIKGRQPAARYHLESVLEFVVRREDGNFTELVDAQDQNGDTALNIAARLGASSLSKLLLEVGASRTLANKHGLRPIDFGVDNGRPNSATGQKLPSEQDAPFGKAHETTQNIISLVVNLRTDFAKEVAARVENLHSTQEQLRTATHQLAEARKAISEQRQRSLDLVQISQRVANLERAIAMEQVATNSKSSDEISLPQDCSPDALVRLRLILFWHQKSCQNIRQRLESVAGTSCALETRYKRVVAMSCGLPVEKVDEMLEQLLVAVESDGGDLDVSRVQSFMARSRQSQTIATE